MIGHVLLTVIPILAVFWMTVGGLMFAFMVTVALSVHVFGRPVKDAETGKVADPSKLARTELLLGGWGLVFAVVGAWLYWRDDFTVKVQFLFAACVVGGLATAVILWSSLCRKPTEP